MSEGTEAPVEDTAVQAPGEKQADVSAPGESDDGYKYAGKYKTTEELEKGYKELSQKLREKQPEAPEAYELAIPSDIGLPEDFSLEEGNPILDAMMPVMREHNVSQEAFNEMLKAYLGAEVSLLPDPAKEMEALGPNANEVLVENENFLAQFSEDEQAELHALRQTAGGNKILNKLAKMARGAKSANIPDKPSDTIQRDPRELLEEAKTIMKSTPNFANNREAVAKYEKLMTDAARLQLARK